MTSEESARAFAMWQRRGQGWRVWPIAVDLEPPYAPPCLPSVCSAQRDDGLRASLLQRLFGERRADVAVTIEPDDAPDVVPEMFYVDEDEIVELQIHVPRDFRTGLAESHQFLVHLRNVAYPISFELVGAADRITAQFACRPFDASTLREAIGAYYHEAVVLDKETTLLSAFAGGGEVLSIVDLGLAEAPFRPLNEPSGYALDPLAGPIAALGSLGEGEAGIAQVVFQPVRRPWAQGFLEAAHLSGNPDVERLTRQKLSSPLFSVAIRVAGVADTPRRAFDISKHVGHALIGASENQLNELFALSGEGCEGIDLEADVYKRQTHRSGMLLSARELVTFVHPPSASVNSERLKRLTLKTKAAPRIAIGNPLRIGVNDHDGGETVVSLSTEQRLRHTYVIGSSGTGKSTLLLNMILQDAEAGHGLAVLDPHGDLIDDLVARLPEDRLRDTVLLDPSDSDYPIGLNILQADSEIETNLLASDLVSVFRRLSTSWGDQMDTIFANAILAFLSSSRGGTLLDLRRFLIDREFRKEYLASVDDEEVRYYWRNAFTLLKGNPHSPIVTRLDTFLRPKLLRYMVAQKDSRLSFRALIDERKILLARLSQGTIGEENSHLLGSLLVTKFNQAALSRQNQSRDERLPFFVYLDEFQKFITPSLADLLTGARKYGVGVTLAHQNLTQAESRNREVASAAASTYTRIFFRTSEADARRLAAELSYFDAADLMNLGTGEAIVRLERSIHDFNVATDRPDPCDNEDSDWRLEVVTATTRDEYAAERSQIEAALALHSAEPAEPLHPSAQITTPDEVSAPAPQAPEPVPLEHEEKPTKVRRAKREVRAQSSPGRGGRHHKYLQAIFEKWGQANGYKTALERPVLDGMGYIDVSLESGTRRIGCEISVTTSVDHELANVSKCIAAGYDAVLWISTDDAALTAAKRALDAESDDVRARVHAVSPEEALSYLGSLDQTSPRETRSSTVRGYKVNVNVSRPSAKDAALKSEVVARILAKSVSKLRKESKR